MAPTDTLYYCGGVYFGLRDDVPSFCWGCKRLNTLAKSSGYLKTFCPMREEATDE